jgi:hypothetical protein
MIIKMVKVRNLNSKEKVFFFIIFFIGFMWHLGLLYQGFLFYDQRLYPAYLSFYADCPPSIEENVTQVLDQKGYQISGFFDYNTSEITIYHPSDTVVRHEVCHLEQKLRHGAYGCNFPVGVYLNELECYIRQDHMSYVNVSEYYP